MKPLAPLRQGAAIAFAPGPGPSIQGAGDPPMAEAFLQPGSVPEAQLPPMTPAEAEALQRIADEAKAGRFPTKMDFEVVAQYWVRATDQVLGSGSPQLVEACRDRLRAIMYYEVQLDLVRRQHGLPPVYTAKSAA